MLHLIPDLIFRAPIPILVIAYLTGRTIRKCHQRTVGTVTINRSTKSNIPLRLSVRSFFRQSQKIRRTVLYITPINYPPFSCSASSLLSATHCTCSTVCSSKFLVLDNKFRGKVQGDRHWSSLRIVSRGLISVATRSLRRTLFVSIWTASTLPMLLTCC